MSGPGEYLPDPTEGITKPEDLAQPKVVLRSRNYEHYSGPRCHHRCGRNNTVTRILHEVGDLIAGRPPDIHEHRRFAFSFHRPADPPQGGRPADDRSRALQR